MFRVYSLDATIKRIKAQLENMLTLSNLFFGGFALISIFQDQYHISTLFIFLAALMDRFDGMVARRLKTESELGKHLDSLCDIVSFGVAPAMLLYQSTIHIFSLPGMLTTCLFIACGAYRLARFNISKRSNEYFTGLPITVAGTFAAFSFLFSSYVSSIFYIFILILLSALMVSPIQFKKM